MKETIIYNKPACVSLGPGDPEMITLKALKTLKNADIIFTPALKSGNSETSRAQDILMELDIEQDKIELFYVPMNKNRSLAKDVYKTIANKIAEKFKCGQKVAFVAEGDAGFYSSAHYISDYLVDLNIPVEQLAGIPAFIACGAVAGLHIVKQNEPLSVYPADVTVDEISSDVLKGKSVVIMKLSKQQLKIKDTISQLPDVQVHYFENIGIENQSFYTNNLDEITNRDFPYFSLMIIKKD